MSTRHRHESAELGKRILALLIERFPRCFVLYERRRYYPLKVGIHLDIIAELGEEIDRRALAIALRKYTSNPFYRKRLVPGAVRVDLNGEPCGTVTELWSDKSKIDLNVNQPTPPAPIITNSASLRAVRRLSLADLRRLADERRRNGNVIAAA